MHELESERPFRVLELHHDLGVGIRSVNLDQGNVPVLLTLLASCLDIVIVEVFSATVRLIRGH